MRRKKYILIAALISLIFIGCAFYEKSTTALSAQEGLSMAQTKEHLFIIDVRPTEDFVQEHFPKAYNIPLVQLQMRLNEIPLGRPVLIHCKTGTAAKEAYDILKKYRPDIKEVYYINEPPVFK